MTPVVQACCATALVYAANDKEPGLVLFLTLILLLLRLLHLLRELADFFLFNDAAVSASKRILQAGSL